MPFFDIPVGPASVFTMILIGYFVMTVWFGKSAPSAVIKSTHPAPSPIPEERPADLNAG